MTKIAMSSNASGTATFTIAAPVSDINRTFTLPDADGIISVFEPGTRMLFAQTAAPTGWTKDTTHNNKALRVVSGTAGSGGSTAFTTVFASRTPAGTVGDTTLTAAQSGLQDHGHSINDPGHRHQLRGDADTAPDGGTSIATDDVVAANKATLSLVSNPEQQWKEINAFNGEIK